MDTKKCKHCELLLHHDSFYKSGKYLSSKCKACTGAHNKTRHEVRRETLRKFQQANPEKCAKYAQKRYYGRQETVRQLVASLKSKPCMDCNHSFPPECMDFDHRPGTQKKFTISQLSGSGACRSDEAIAAELAKCDLVCACCHRIRTFSRYSNHKYQQAIPVT